MTAGQDNPGELRAMVLRRGRMALEALRSREQAALFHAARADLQVALDEAEVGNDQFLRNWLDQYRSLMEQDPDLQRQLSSVQSTLEFTDASVATMAAKLTQEDGLRSKPLSSASNIARLSSPIADPQAMNAERAIVKTEDTISPWPAMIEGARQRARDRGDQSSTRSATPRETTLPTDASARLQSEPVTENVDEAPKPMSVAGKVVRPIQSTRGVQPPAKPTLLARPAKKNASPKNRTWLSWSFIGSMAAHFLALIGMSSFMIHWSRPPEPHPILASAVESETISMETPIEMSTSEVPVSDPTETFIPKLPTFSAASSATGSNLQLPESLTGLVTGDGSRLGQPALEQATGAAMSSTAMNSVEFFGVKAAGNTFCYVVDVSPSMKKDNALTAAKAELVRSLSLLKPKQRFYITFFGSEIERLILTGPSEEVYPVYATPENLQRALIWIQRVGVQASGLPPNNALKQAISLEPDGIFLLFDGETTVDVAAYLRKVNRSDDLISSDTPLVPIHTIGFYTQEFEALLKRIAHENSGVYRFVPKPIKTR